MPRPAFSFIDLFAGIGGIRLAFESIGGRCVFTSEWDENARKTYAANFDTSHPFAGDIWKVGLDEIPAHDVLVGGFPCQPFSLAGVSKKNSLGRAHGFACETQGTLFFRIAEIIREKRPQAFVLENVKNLQSHDRGNTFRIILDVLENQLGYSVSWRVVDAQRWLPQHRERIFIVGFREDVGFRWPDESRWPAPGSVKLGRILHPRGYRYLPLYELSDDLWRYLQAYRRKHEQKGNGFGFGLVGPGDVARTLSARYHKDGSEILVDQGSGRNPRRLTPRECARLMGFPDSFVLPDTVSDTQLYRQFGNSVAVPAVKAVAEAMRPYLRRAAHARQTRSAAPALRLVSSA